MKPDQRYIRLYTHLYTGTARGPTLGLLRLPRWREVWRAGEADFFERNSGWQEGIGREVGFVGPEGSARTVVEEESEGYKGG